MRTPPPPIARPSDFIDTCVKIKDAGKAIEFYKQALGHEWSIATHKEDLSPEEIERRGREAMSKMGGCQPD